MLYTCRNIAIAVGSYSTSQLLFYWLMFCSCICNTSKEWHVYVSEVSVNMPQLTYMQVLVYLITYLVLISWDFEQVLICY